MSGTPSISEPLSLWKSSGGPVGGDLPVSLVVLTRGPRSLRGAAVAELARWGFCETLVVEGGPLGWDPRPDLGEVPGVRVLAPAGNVGPGVRVNLAAREVQAPRFLVVWDDLGPDPTGWPHRALRAWGDASPLALTPELLDPAGQALPSVRVPATEAGRLKVLALGTDEENVDTLFPVDYAALYDRRRFLATGGFDPEIASPFWQRFDWGLRARLWGESLVRQRSWALRYRSSPPTDDQTPDRSSARFWLRNAAVRHVGDHGILPWSRWPAYAAASGLGLLGSWWEFRRARRWVGTHRFRFVTDVRQLVERWGQS